MVATVQITNFGTKGIGLVASWEPDIVIVSYNLPEMNGYQVAPKSDQIYSDVAIILLSGVLLPTRT